MPLPCLPVLACLSRHPAAVISARGKRSSREEISTIMGGRAGRQTTDQGERSSGTLGQANRRTSNLILIVSDLCHATPSVFHQYHVRRVLRSSRDDRR